MLKTIRWYVAALGMATLMACGDEGPGTAHIGGVWRGQYSNSDAFHADQTVRFTFTQSGTVVSGQMSLSGGTVANIAGTMSGTHFTGTLSYTGSCPGIATTEASIVARSRLDGTYELTDCNGATTGTYTVRPDRTTS